MMQLSLFLIIEHSIAVICVLNGAHSAVISRSFIKSSFIYTVAGTLPVASAIILLPFYIYYLSTDTFGAFSIFLAFSILTQILTTFSYEATVYIHYHEYKSDPARLSSYVGSVMCFVACSSLIHLVLFYFSGELIVDLIFPEETLSFYPYGYVCLGIGIFQSVFKIHSNLLQTREKPVIFFLVQCFIIFTYCWFDDRRFKIIS